MAATRGRPHQNGSDAPCRNGWRTSYGICGGGVRFSTQATNLARCCILCVRDRKFISLSAKERIEIVQGDITAQDEWFDVIANAANESLLGGGGVDGAIHSAAGPDLLKFCQSLGGCSVGSAKLSPGFKLRARHIAHAVGPRWQSGVAGESEALASAYQSIMELAIEQRATRIALPSISTGAFGFPLERAAAIAISTVMEILEPSRVRLVRFVCFDDSTLTAYQDALSKVS